MYWYFRELTEENPDEDQSIGRHRIGMSLLCLRSKRRGGKSVSRQKLTGTRSGWGPQTMVKHVDFLLTIVKCDQKVLSGKRHGHLHSRCSSGSFAQDSLHIFTKACLLELFPPCQWLRFLLLGLSMSLAGTLGGKFSSFVFWHKDLQVI